MDPEGRGGRGVDEGGAGVSAIPAIRMERLGGMVDRLRMGGMEKIGDGIGGMVR